MSAVGVSSSFLLSWARRVLSRGRGRSRGTGSAPRRAPASPSSATMTSRALCVGTSESVVREQPCPQLCRHLLRRRGETYRQRVTRERASARYQPGACDEVRLAVVGLDAISSPLRSLDHAATVGGAATPAAAQRLSDQLGDRARVMHVSSFHEHKKRPQLGPSVLDHHTFRSRGAPSALRCVQLVARNANRIPASYSPYRLARVQLGHALLDRLRVLAPQTFAYRRLRISSRHSPINSG